MKPTTPEYTCHCFSFSLPRLSSQSKLIPSKVRTLYIKFMHIWQHSRCTRSHTRSSSIIIKFQHQPELDSTPPPPLLPTVPLIVLMLLPRQLSFRCFIFCLLVFFVFFSAARGSKVLAVAQFDLRSWMKRASGGKQGHFGNIKTLPCNYNKNT